MTRSPETEARGILLAGGTGSRLAPLTDQMSKHLLPVDETPMICYPLATLMQAGIRHILIISTPTHLAEYKKLLGSGETLGVNFEYAEQKHPDGLPQALTIGAAFTNSRPVVLMLGDNIFWGGSLIERLGTAIRQPEGATLFALEQPNAEQYGVVEFGGDGEILALSEKPKAPKSSWVITGAYVFDRHAAEFAATLAPSARGETEMTDLLECYRSRGLLRADCLEPKTRWFDAGTPKTLAAAAQAVGEARQAGNTFLGKPDRIASANGWIA